MNISRTKALLFIIVVVAIFGYFVIRQIGYFETADVIRVDTSDWVEYDFGTWTMLYPYDEYCVDADEKPVNICFTDPDGNERFFLVPASAYESSEVSQEAQDQFICGYDFESCVDFYRTARSGTLTVTRIDIDKERTFGELNGRELQGAWRWWGKEFDFRVFIAENDEGTEPIVLILLDDLSSADDDSPYADAVFEEVLSLINP